MPGKQNLMDFEELSLEPKACSSICTLTWMPNGMCEDKSSLEISIKEDKFCSVCYTNRKRKSTEYFCLPCKIRICKECFDNHRKLTHQLQELVNSEVEIMNNHAEMPETKSLTILEEPPSLEPTAHPSVCTLAQLPNGKSNDGSSLEISIKEKNLCSICYAKKNRKLTEYYCLLCKVRICQECFEDHKKLTRQLQKPKQVHVTFMRYHAKKMPGKQDLEKKKHSKICILSKMPKKRSKFQRWIRRTTICSVCSVPEKRIRTTYHCSSCKVGVCQTCFDYHQKITHQRLGLKNVEICIEKLRETQTMMTREEEKPDCLKPTKHTKVCVLLKIPKRFSKISSKWIQPEKRCSICSNSQKIKRTTFICASCEVGVCQKCFDCHQKLIHQTLEPESKKICIKKPLETQSLMTHKEEEPETHKIEEPETHKVEEPETHKVEEPETHKVEEPETHKVEEPETHKEEEPETYEEEEPDYLKLTNNFRKCALGRLPFGKSTTLTTRRRQVTNCSVCSSEELMKRTVFYCTLCDVGVCSNCFDKHRNYIERKGKTRHFQFNRSCLLGKLPKLPSSKSAKLIQREKPCTVCSTRTKKKRTVYYCMPCNVGVCKECFNGHCERTATSKKRYRLSALRYR